MLLPRLLRALHHPGLAVLLGLVLIGVAIFGLATDDIKTPWATLILIVGLINALRAIPRPAESG